MAKSTLLLVGSETATTWAEEILAHCGSCGSYLQVDKITPDEIAEHTKLQGNPNTPDANVLVFGVTPNTKMYAPLELIERAKECSNLIGNGYSDIAILVLRQENSVAFDDEQFKNLVVNADKANDRGISFFTTIEQLNGFITICTATEDEALQVATEEFNKLQKLNDIKERIITTGVVCLEDIQLAEDISPGIMTDEYPDGGYTLQPSDTNLDYAVGCLSSEGFKFKETAIKILTAIWEAILRAIQAIKGFIPALLGRLKNSKFAAYMSGLRDKFNNFKTAKPTTPNSTNSETMRKNLAYVKAKDRFAEVYAQLSGMPVDQVMSNFNEIVNNLTSTGFKYGDINTGLKQQLCLVKLTQMPVDNRKRVLAVSEVYRDQIALTAGATFSNLGAAHRIINAASTSARSSGPASAAELVPIDTAFIETAKVLPMNTVVGFEQFMRALNAATDFSLLDSQPLKYDKPRDPDEINAAVMYTLDVFNKYFEVARHAVTEPEVKHVLDTYADHSFLEFLKKQTEVFEQSANAIKTNLSTSYNKMGSSIFEIQAAVDLHRSRHSVARSKVDPMVNMAMEHILTTTGHIQKLIKVIERVSRIMMNAVHNIALMTTAVGNVSTQLDALKAAVDELALHANP